MNYQQKYLKYKEKYLKLKNQMGGAGDIGVYISSKKPKDFKLSSILMCNELDSGILRTTTFGDDFTYLAAMNPEWGKQLHAYGNSMTFEELRDITMNGLIFWYCKFIIGLWEKKNSGSEEKPLNSNYAKSIYDTDETLVRVFATIRTLDYLQQYGVAFSRLKIIVEKANRHPQNNAFGKLCDKIQLLIILTLFRIINPTTFECKEIEEHTRNFMFLQLNITKQQIDFLQVPVNDDDIPKLHVDYIFEAGKHKFINIGYKE